ncbi:MAG: CoA-acylating methylmalonate-semialdehyde dehydrogenase [Litorivicinaceae bacterium]|jgi:malonate-semialdehyde dehydrogenase (acetylating) / methylmalonate-semialdehyde dehydrogenase|nr:CoA-acylating methylmalonate-semialdehyde dehydrogenase [Litorivicinaceae bacterium]
MTQSIIPMYIDGQFTQGAATWTIPVLNPATQAELGQLPVGTATDVEHAVAAAKAAFIDWRETPVSERARLMMRYQEAVRDHHDALAEIICEDLGKNFEDAKGDVFRGLEVIEQAIGIAQTSMGEYAGNVARGVDTYSIHQPMGVFAGITPFNFPAMIPLWMFPLAIAAGNTFVLKPSEQDPLCPVRLTELFLEAGAPANILQLLHGDKDTANALITHPDIQGVSFVGSVPVGRHIYETAARAGKRVQAMAGAKNHMVVMPDADKTAVINALMGASCGAAGQRCMAISVVVLVGEAQAWLPEIVDAMRALTPNYWKEPGAAYGPVVSQAAKTRIEALIEVGAEEGAELVVDGRGYAVPGYPNGNWVGPTLFANVTSEMQIYQEEVFGPVLCQMNAADLDEALAIINASTVGNGTSIFTASGAAARRFQHEVEVGMVGINVPIPVPLPFFSFTGWKQSFFGDLHAYGKQAVKFYTRTKTVTARWKDSPQSQGANMSIQLK